jgi:hypothetical protein
VLQWERMQAKSTDKEWGVKVVKNKMKTNTTTSVLHRFIEFHDGMSWPFLKAHNV